MKTGFEWYAVLNDDKSRLMAYVGEDGHLHPMLFSNLQAANIAARKNGGGKVEKCSILIGKK